MGHRQTETRCSRGTRGGAPANVLTALSRLGAKTAIIGKVGNDQFGRFPLDDAEREIKRGLQYADILKISEEELVFITKETDSQICAVKAFGEGIPFVADTFYRTLSASNCLRIGSHTAREARRLLVRHLQ